eukprot:8942161-Ditylum_brightwellii.AAC.1
MPLPLVLMASQPLTGGKGRCCDEGIGSYPRQRAHMGAQDISGHTTEAPVSIPYSNVVSKECVRLAFFIAELNNLEVKTLDCMRFNSTMVDPDIYQRKNVREDVAVLVEMGRYHKLKNRPDDPTICLDASIENFQLQDGHDVWNTSIKQYVKNVVITVQRLILDDDSSEYLNHTMANQYLQLVGILRWAVELGRICIVTK